MERTHPNGYSLRTRINKESDFFRMALGQPLCLKVFLVNQLRIVLKKAQGLACLVQANSTFGLT